MPDPAHEFNPLSCQADFTYTMALSVVKIMYTGKGAKSVGDKLEAVLQRIQYWHQGSIAGYRISYRDSAGLEHKVQWNGKEARVNS